LPSPLPCPSILGLCSVSRVPWVAPAPACPLLADDVLSVTMGWSSPLCHRPCLPLAPPATLLLHAPVVLHVPPAPVLPCLPSATALGRGVALPPAHPLPADNAPFAVWSLLLPTLRLHVLPQPPAPPCDRHPVPRDCSFPYVLPLPLHALCVQTCFLGIPSAMFGSANFHLHLLCVPLRKIRFVVECHRCHPSMGQGRDDTQHLP